MCICVWFAARWQFAMQCSWFAAYSEWTDLNARVSWTFNGSRFSTHFIEMSLKISKSNIRALECIFFVIDYFQESSLSTTVSQQDCLSKIWNVWKTTTTTFLILIENNDVRFSEKILLRVVPVRRRALISSNTWRTSSSFQDFFYYSSTWIMKLVFELYSFLPGILSTFLANSLGGTYTLSSNMTSSGQ